MTLIDMDLWQRMSEASKRFVAIWMEQNDLPATTVEMEDTPSGLRVAYYAVDPDGRMSLRHGKPVLETKLMPDLKLPWEDV